MQILKVHLYCRGKWRTPLCSVAGWLWGYTSPAGGSIPLPAAPQGSSVEEQGVQLQVVTRLKRVVRFPPSASNSSCSLVEEQGV